MSYLAWPRLHFAGQFQADPSTVNNEARHYNNATFKPRYQDYGPGATNGWWNPEGTGSWRFVGCSVSGVVYDDGTACYDAADDAVIGMQIRGADAQVAGKIVDLDPAQQGASQLWGLIVRLVDQDTAGSPDLLRGDYTVSPFTDMWTRPQSQSSGDMGLGAYWQSQVVNIVWGDVSDSLFLQQLKTACPDGKLSIKFEVDGYNMEPTSDNFTLGRLVGTIGPVHTIGLPGSQIPEPERFVFGRQLMPATLDSHGNPPEQVYFLPGQINQQQTKLTLDFGDSLPTDSPGGPLTNIGHLDVAILPANGSAPMELGDVHYQHPDWYERTAGVQDFPAHRELSAAELAALADSPIAVRKVQRNKNGSKTVLDILVQESPTGLYVRADDFVQRLNPGSKKPRDVDLYVSYFGAPPPQSEVIDLAFDNSRIGGGPAVGTPTSALPIPSSLTADGNGHAVLSLSASDPGNPRGYIDGQVYGIGYTLRSLAKQPYTYDPFNFISILVWNHTTWDGDPTWWGNIQPILQQYANLYPIMSKRLIDLGDYDAVVGNSNMLKMVFTLPDCDPNYMPVTRDLSASKLAMLLKWFDTQGPDGLPLKGTPPAGD